MANQSYNRKPTPLEQERRRDSYERQCCGKIRYLGERDASWQLNQMRERKVSGWERLETYECPHCDGLHIGHRPEPMTHEKAVALVKDFEREQVEYLSGPNERGTGRAGSGIKIPPEQPGTVRQNPDLPPEFLEIAAGSLLRVGFSN
jgi:hypothetical protein